MTMSNKLGQTLSRYPNPNPFDFIYKTRTAIGSAPSFNVCYALFCNTSDGSTSNDSVAATIEVVYEAEFTGPKNTYAS
jgi:hypothetical protein